MPLRTDDGRYRSEFRFRIDASAADDDVGTLHALLRLRPPGTTILFALERERGVRALRIEGPDIGDVFAFASRIVAAIRKIGDLALDAPIPVRPAETPEPQDVTARLDTGESLARWSYEPPETFLGNEHLDAATAPTVLSNALDRVARLFGRRPAD